MHAFSLAIMSEELEKIASLPSARASGTTFLASRTGTSVAGAKGLPPVTVTKPIPAPKPMGMQGIKIGSLGEALAKISSELTAAGRDHIKDKNFALSSEQSDTGKPAYPIHDKAHAANALARVKQHGSPSEKAEVYRDVAKKFPGLAAHSSVPAVREKEKDADMGMPMSAGGPPASPLPGMARGGSPVTMPPGNMSQGAS